MTEPNQSFAYDNVMRQVLFEIPLPFGDAKLPLFGFGVMLLVCFVVCGWLAGRRAKAEGIDPNDFWDIALWLFFGGVVGARVTSLILDGEPGGFWTQVLQFFKIWEGGMVFYGCLPGGFIAYLFVRKRIIQPKGIRLGQLADIIAPMLGLGLFFGRMGCFLNGCCYGLPADPTVTAAWQQCQFPTNSIPHHKLVEQGQQLGYDFLLAEATLPPQYRAKDERTVLLVTPGSAAESAGLKAGDIITKVGGQDTPTVFDVFKILRSWPSREPLILEVRRAADTATLTFIPPPSRPLLPAQLYSSLDGLLLFLVLWSYYPFRRREGAVFALMMLLHGISRFNLEQLRSDNPPFLFGLTVSQNISIALCLGGAALMYWVQRYGRIPGPPVPPANTGPSALALAPGQ